MKPYNISWYLGWWMIIRVLFCKRCHFFVGIIFFFLDKMVGVSILLLYVNFQNLNLGGKETAKTSKPKKRGKKKKKKKKEAAKPT